MELTTKKKRRTSRYLRGEIFQSYAMISFSVIGLILFVIYPMGWTLRWCLYRFGGITAPRFIGLDNFARIFGPNGARYWQAVGVSSG